MLASYPLYKNNMSKMLITNLIFGFGLLLTITASIYGYIQNEILISIESTVLFLTIIFLFSHLKKYRATISLHNNHLKKINELTQENKNLKLISSTDQLTGLCNRNKIEETFIYEKKQALRYHTDLSLIIMDLDHFKSLNDSHGHNTGDTFLKEISQELISIFRDTDVIGRWGGEEFLILLPKTNLETAQEIAERLRQSIEKKVFAGIEDKTASFGVA